MNNKNKIFKLYVKNSQESLIRAQVFCEVIDELFIFSDCKETFNDNLNRIFKNDIEKFIAKQKKKLDYILTTEANSYDY